MGLIKNVKEYVYPSAVTFYVLQPGKTFFIKDIGLSIPIGGMENEMRLEETILKLKKSNLLIPKFKTTSVKTFFGMKEVCFAYMADYRTIVPMGYQFNDDNFDIEPEDYNLQYLRGTIRTYQDLQFKKQSRFEQYFLPMMFLIGMLGLGIFMKMSLTKFESIVDKLSMLDDRVADIVDRVPATADKVPDFPPQ